MKKITEQEYRSLISSPNYGFVCFMGGINLGAWNMIYCAGEEFIIFTQQEIEDEIPELQRIREIMIQESKDYFEGYRSCR